MKANDQNGFISWEMINTFSVFFFRIILCLLLAAIFSFSDIDIDQLSYQGFLNDMQYPIELVQKVFNK